MILAQSPAAGAAARRAGRRASLGRAMRICLVYDCLYPCTVGGAERWYRNLAERLSEEGHEVTYLTLRQWNRGEDPGVEGVDVVAVGPRMDLYSRRGTRRVMPPLIFGAASWHLLRHGSHYDTVHTASFPYFSLLAAAATRPLGGYGLVVDWHEVWSASSGASTWALRLGGQRGAALGRPGFPAGVLLLASARGPPRGARAARAADHPARWMARVTGPALPAALGGGVVFAGRLIPEKQAPPLVSAVMLAAERLRGTHGAIYGGGPDRGAVLAEIDRHGAAHTRVRSRLHRRRRTEGGHGPSHVRRAALAARRLWLGAG